MRRRALLAALPALPLAIPASAAAAAPPEHPWDRARRLARELSDALDDIDEIGMGQHVAIVYRHAHVGFADHDYYDQLWSKIMTEEQAEAVAEYRSLVAAQRRQWELYCSFTRRCTKREKAYRVWQAIYARVQDAQTVMTRRFLEA